MTFLGTPGWWERKNKTRRPYERIFESRKKCGTSRICDVSTGHINYGHANVVAISRSQNGLYYSADEKEFFFKWISLPARGARDWRLDRVRRRAVRLGQAGVTRPAIRRPRPLPMLDAAEVKVENVRERTNKIPTATLPLHTDAKSTGEYNNDRAPPLSYFSYKFFF